MEVLNEEQVKTEEEQEVKETPEAEAEEKTEVTESAESEGEETEGAPKSAEEIEETKFQERIKDEYAKWQSKTLTPVSKERDELRKQVNDLNAKLEDKTDNKELDLLLKGETDELGEDDAKKRDEIRRKYNQRFKEYREKAAQADEAKKEAETTAEKLGGIERHQMARERAYAILMPQDKEFDKALDSIVKELEEAESPEHMDRLAKLVVRERQGKQKPFKPDSGRNSGGGIDLSKLSSEERIAYALKKMDRKK